MTHITKPRGPWALAAEVRDGGKPRALVIEIDPVTLMIRQKGRRTWYELPWAAIYEFAVRADVDRRRREKAAARKAKGR